MRKIEKSPYAGGTGVVEYHMRRNCWRQLTEQEASALWTECKAQLIKMRLRSTVRECEETVGGSLDTLPRGDVLDALSLVLVQLRWPMNMADDDESTRFCNAMRDALAVRGYKRVPDEEESEQPA